MNFQGQRVKGQYPSVT